jgi:DNA polymerase-4
MRCLPVEDLFMVGRSTAPKLHKMNINTIGDLANHDINIIKSVLKSHGVMIWNFANGIEDSAVRASNYIEMKGMGNSTTIPFDVDDRKTARMVILSLCETIGMRLRNSNNCCGLVCISFRTNKFEGYSKQRKLYYTTDSTSKIANMAYELFDEIWKGEAIRHIGVAVSELCTNEFCQLSIYDADDEKIRAIDNAVDSIRMRYGAKSIVRSIFVQSGIKPLSGGVEEEDYPMMSSLL